jgi:hypothetical protein
MLTLSLPRRLTIEEVSVVFDTGRVGSAKAAVEQFKIEKTQSHVAETGDADVDKAQLEHIEIDPVKA